MTTYHEPREPWREAMFREQRLRLPVQEQLDSIRDRVLRVEADFSRTMLEGNKQERNKLGVALHADLERATSDLQSLYDTLGKTDWATHYERVDELDRSLRSMMDQVLEKVFRIIPQQRSPKPRMVDTLPKHVSKHEAVSAQFAALDEAFKSNPKAVPSVIPSAPYSNGDVAGITIEYNGVHYSGSAKRNPVDKPDPAIGLAVAEARAVRQLWKALQKRADRMVADADAERMRRKKKAARPKVRGERIVVSRPSYVQEEREFVEHLTAENRSLRQELTATQDANARNIERLKKAGVAPSRATPRKKRAAVKKAAPRKRTAK